MPPDRLNFYLIAVVAAAGLALLSGSTPARAETAIIGASRDTSIYEEGELSNGGGHHLFAGRTGPIADNFRRRALIAFDIAGALPADVTITEVILTLHLTRSRFFAPETDAFLFPITANWGEGSVRAPGVEGAGGAAAVGDATWAQRFLGGSNTAWSVPGGDFEASASASSKIGFLPNEDFPVPYTWDKPGLVSDVQSWLDSPETNFGWMLVNDEAIGQAAKRFASSENPNLSIRPSLAVTYVPEPGMAGLLGVGALLLLRRRVLARA